MDPINCERSEHIVTDDTLLEYATKHYNESPTEMKSDLHRTTYIKRLLKNPKDQSRYPLIINHIKTLGNVFGIEAATNILLCRIPEPSLQPLLMTFLSNFEFP